MEVVKYQEKRDYPEIKKWWESRGFTAPQKDMLNHKYGYMAVDSSGPIAALFLYPIDGSKIAYHGFPSSNPLKSRLSRKLALNILYDIIEDEAKKLGYKYLWTESGVKPVEEALNAKSHVKADKNVNQYIKVI